MRTEQKDETFQSLLEPNILTDKIVAVSKLFRILSWWCWLESKQTASQSTKKDLLDNDWVNWLSYLEEPYPDADPADDSNVVLDLVAEFVQTALDVDLHGGVGGGLVEDPQATADDVGETAGVRDVVL